MVQTDRVAGGWRLGQRGTLELRKYDDFRLVPGTALPFDLYV